MKKIVLFSLLLMFILAQEENNVFLIKTHLKKEEIEELLQHPVQYKKPQKHNEELVVNEEKTLDEKEQTNLLQKEEKKEEKKEKKDQKKEEKSNEKNEKKSVKDELKNEVEIVEDDSNIKNQTTLLVENTLAETEVPTIKSGSGFFSYVLALIIIVSFITLLLNATKAKKIKLSKMNDLKSYFINEHKKYDYEENDYQNLRNY
jgi:outer membrane biosynthesis protein TonB